jgi:hypothetical protein
MYEISLSLSAPSIAIGCIGPRPRNSACRFSAKRFASSRIWPSSCSVDSISAGMPSSRCTSPRSRSASALWNFASATTSMPSAASCVVKAFVDATPISGPARVSITSSDSRTSELSGTLQIASCDRYPACFASLSAASVSAVSPDCDTLTNSVFFGHDRVCE